MTAEVEPKKSDKKEKLVGAAIQLMLAQGYAATSVDEICSVAGVTKGSFFHYFPNKEAICRAAMDAWAGAWCQILVEAELEAAEDPLGRIDRLFTVMEEVYMQPKMNIGCMIGTVAQEVSSTNRQLGDSAQALLDGWAGIIVKLLVDAKAAYPPRIDFDPESLADFMLGVVQGTFLVARTRQDRAVILNNIAHCRAYVNMLFGRDALEIT